MAIPLARGATLLMPALADAEIMELNVWLKSTMERDPTYDPQTKKWTVKIKRDGEEDRVLNVSHIVLATGFSGEPRKPTFPIDEFKGIVHHSSAHPGARGKGWEGKKAVGASRTIARQTSADLLILVSHRLLQQWVRPTLLYCFPSFTP